MIRTQSRRGRRRAVVVIAACVAALAVVVVQGTSGRAEALAEFAEVPGSPLPLGPHLNAVAYSPDGRLLAAASDNVVSVISVDPTGTLTPKFEWRTPASALGARGVKFNASGSMLAVGETMGLSLLSISTDGTPWHISNVSYGGNGSNGGVAFTATGAYLAVGEVNLTDETNGPDAVFVYGVGPDGNLSPRPVGRVDVSGAIASISSNPAGSLLAVVGSAEDDTLSMVSIDDSGIPHVVSTAYTGAEPWSAAWMSGGAYLAVSNRYSESLSVFAVSSSGGLRSVTPEEFPLGYAPMAVASNPSGRLLAVGSTDGVIRMYALNAWGQPSPVIGEPFRGIGQIGSIAFGADGGLLALVENQSNLHEFAVAAPSATITTPQAETTFTVGRAVTTKFNCADSRYAPGIKSCVDSNGSTGSSGHLDTKLAGKHVYTVTATSRDGQAATASLEYIVVRIATRLVAAPLTAHIGTATAVLTGGGKFLAGRLVQFRVGEVIACTAVTNLLGTARCTFPLDARKAALAAKAYSAGFAGDATYLPSTVTAQVLP